MTDTSGQLGHQEAEARSPGQAWLNHYSTELTAVNFEQLSGGRTDTAPDLAKHHTETDHWQETSPAANLAATDVPRSVHTTCELGFYAVAGDGFEPS
jgi:hypothetical protein